MKPFQSMEDSRHGDAQKGDNSKWESVVCWRAAAGSCAGDRQKEEIFS
eukprot:CAMPEP_0194034406 /NCGR_PEP_ID=MMETSP0009_2-20130614/6821_1 /TAXON_ID=210454 /ORGANISM="Grammatophora oceanica, Strain CCMP 410" /LENGTH=47 /DNA_ID= /DNA_START= /DNA_END= /DNA_ORIENTATION=